MRAVLLATCIALVACGCWQSRQGLEAPDLTNQYEEIDATVGRLERIGETVDDELTDLSGRVDRFFETSNAVWARPFPLDAFKHTAMSCLNAPYSQAEPEPSVYEVAERLRVSCAVPAALDLERQLAEVPSQREIALEKLREIDEIRSVRAQLQSRLRQLPSIVRRTRAYITSRRAEARQMVKDVQSRQGEYNRKSYKESMERIDEYERRLAALERKLEALEGTSGRWSKQLGTIVDRLYKDLSRIRPS